MKLVMMANSNRRLIFVTCLLVVSSAHVNSSATCPIDVVLRLDSCSNLVDWIISGRAGNPPKAQCCGVVGSLDGQVAADCLCVVLTGDLSGSQNVNVDSTLGLIFSVCEKQEPAGYQCV